jgi:hypothetical protein
MGIPKGSLNQFRPQPTGNVQQDIANRQIFDLIQNLRTNFIPTSLFSVGSGAVVPVPPSVDDSDPGSAFGLSLTLNRPGTWIVHVDVCLQIIGDTDPFTLCLRVAKNRLPSFAITQFGANAIVMVGQTWRIAGAAGTEILTPMIKKKTGAAGTSAVDPANSTFTALWEGA